MEHGTNIQVKIPFLYTIGEEGYYTDKVLNTVEDCIEEVKAELEANESFEDLFFEVETETELKFKAVLAKNEIVRHLKGLTEELSVGVILECLKEIEAYTGVLNQPSVEDIIENYNL